MIRFRIPRTLAVLPLLLLIAGCASDGPMRPGRDIVALGAPPAGYYDTVDASSAAALRTSLHEIIDDHTRYPYTSTATDTWDILELADQDPNDSGRILDVYRNASYAKQGGGNTLYNREHSWPNSYGYPNDNSSNYPYTDCHALFLADDGYNSSRSNKPYRTCDAACSENPTDANNGAGGGTGVYPGNSNWTSGQFTTGTWETWIGRRGDVARALLYLDVRYEGGTHGVTGASEPDLVLTDDEGLIAASNTGSNESMAYMGMLSVLLQWSQEDPVDAVEQARNDAVFSFQGNRNPFVDHPEWIDCVFAGGCSVDTVAPAVPTGLLASAGDALVSLEWDDNAEPDLGGYNVWRSETGGAPFTKVNASPVAVSAYADASVANGTTYTYTVSAVDLSGNESGLSATAEATPQGGGGGATVWINEFHYDNAGGDVGEFVEVAGTAGTSLSGWTVLGYNGANGDVYDAAPLSGTVPDQQGGFGTVAVAFPGLQNGSPDAIALVDGGGTVVEFLSYEGQVTAVAGPAAGLTSTDVGVAETSGTPVGDSIQRAGSGTQASDFTWQPPQADTPGAPNVGQTFGGGGGDTTPPAAPSGLAAVAGDGNVDLDWNDNGEPDLGGYNVHRSTTPGGPYSQINGAPVNGSVYTDGSVTNGTTYHYVVTAVDLTGNESDDSNEASATPQGGGGGSAMHVASIVPSTVPAGGRNERGRAVVTVVDAGGQPVTGAFVAGSFSGDVQGTASGTTDGSGAVTLTSNGKAKGPITFTFCVDDVTLSGWTYDSGANAETCDSAGSARVVPTRAP